MFSKQKSSSRSAKQLKLKAQAKPKRPGAEYRATPFDHAIRRVLATLAPRSRSVIERRFGLLGETPHTLDAIGQQEQITRERVRQLENASVHVMRTSSSYSALKPHFKALDKLLMRCGGVLSDAHMESAEVFGSIQSKQAALFLLKLAPFAHRCPRGPSFGERWYHKSADAAGLEKALLAFAKSVRATERAYPEREFFACMAKFIRPVGGISKPALMSYFQCCTDLAQNAYQEFGHSMSRMVRPWGMSDEAYITLSKAGHPMHFTEVAGSIVSSRGRIPALTTVHNCLVVDERFALVGRGTYGLTEWGYLTGPRPKKVTTPNGNIRRQRRRWKHIVHQN